MIKDKLNFLSKLIPIGGIFITLCSSLKLIIFYNHFNISISEYLSLPEYATLFIDDIVYYLLIFGGAFIINELKSQTEKDKKLEDEKDKKLSKIVIYIVATIVIITATTLILKTNSTAQKIQDFKVGIFILLILFYNYLPYTNSKIKFTYREVLFITVVFYIIMDGFVDAHKIIENKNKLEYSIELKNDTIKTDKNLKFLGKSDKFFFFYNLVNKKSLIIPNQNFQKIEVTENGS